MSMTTNSPAKASSEPAANEAEAPPAGSNTAPLDFHETSTHLSHKRPGYYLILLRNELKHRSLSERPPRYGAK